MERHYLLFNQLCFRRFDAKLFKIKSCLKVVKEFKKSVEFKILSDFFQSCLLTGVNMYIYQYIFSLFHLKLTFNLI